MEELGLTDDGVKQINTDSITFYTKSTREIKLGNTLDDWKRAPYKPITKNVYDLIEDPITFFQTIPNENTIITGNAGNGKSYYIQHMDLTDAIIVSSKHSAIRQHKEKGLNAHVIQKFSYGEETKTTIPAEKHIIVEECGILTRQNWDFLYKCALLGKKLTMLGDFTQLLPVDEIHTFNRPAFIGMMFANQVVKNDNYRNNFSAEYYETLKNGTKEYLMEQIKKYSTDKPEDADVIIAYRNKIVDKYNEYMLEYHDKTINDDDVPVMCITNDLREHDMFNNFFFLSQEIEPSLLNNEKYFKPAYARTLYNMQGDDCGSYYVAPEDLHWFCNPRMAYTLVSRLKKNN
jgi:hypothetical protein